MSCKVSFIAREKKHNTDLKENLCVCEFQLLETTYTCSLVCITRISHTLFVILFVFPVDHYFLYAYFFFRIYISLKNLFVSSVDHLCELHRCKN